MAGIAVRKVGCGVDVHTPVCKGKSLKPRKIIPAPI